MQQIKHTKTMTAYERAIARFAYTNSLRDYVRYAHKNKVQCHFAEFSADVCIKFCECMNIAHINNKTVELAQVAFNYAHIHYAAQQSFTQTAEKVLGKDFAKYKQTVLEIAAQVAASKINVSNNFYTAY
jgi:hypothetical protein